MHSYVFKNVPHFLFYAQVVNWFLGQTAFITLRVKLAATTYIGELDTLAKVTYA